MALPARSPERKEHDCNGKARVDHQDQAGGRALWAVSPGWNEHTLLEGEGHRGAGSGDEGEEKEEFEIN